jgi:hypothetical protein
MNEFQNPLQSRDEAMASRPISRYVGSKETMRRANAGVSPNPVISRPQIQPPPMGGPQPATTGMPMPMPQQGGMISRVMSQPLPMPPNQNGGINPGGGAISPVQIGGMPGPAPMPRMAPRPMQPRVSLADEFGGGSTRQF